MSFLTTADYGTRLKDANLAALLGEVPSTSQILLNAQVEAESQVLTYLYQRYDTDVIFAQTGTNRHAYLVGLCVTIALYKLYQRLPKRVTPEWITQEYNDSLTFLERVDDGKTHLDLPRKTATDALGNTAATTKFIWGSDPKQS